MAKKLNREAAGPQTLAIHAGEGPDPVTGASGPNIVMSSTFVTDKREGFSAHELTDASPDSCPHRSSASTRDASIWGMRFAPRRTGWSSGVILAVAA